MVFSSIIFLFVFLPIVLMLYYIIHPNLRNIFCSQQEVYVQLVGQMSTKLIQLSKQIVRMLLMLMKIINILRVALPQKFL